MVHESLTLPGSLTDATNNNPIHTKQGYVTRLHYTGYKNGTLVIKSSKKSGTTPSEKATQ